MVKSAIATLWIQDCPNGSKWCLASTIIAGGFSCHSGPKMAGGGSVWTMPSALGIIRNLPRQDWRLASNNPCAAFGHMSMSCEWDGSSMKFPVTSKACVHNASTNAPEAMLSRFLAARTLWAVRDSMWWGWRWVAPWMASVQDTAWAEASRADVVEAPPSPLAA